MKYFLVRCLASPIEAYPEFKPNTGKDNFLVRCLASPIEANSRHARPGAHHAFLVRCLASPIEARPSSHAHAGWIAFWSDVWPAPLKLPLLCTPCGGGRPLSGQMSGQPH